MKRLNSYQRLSKEEAIRLEALRLSFQFWRVTGRYETENIRRVADLMVQYIKDGKYAE